MTLYCDPKVKWGGMEVGGIRISHLSDIDKEMVMMLTQTQKQRAPFKVKPLTTAAPASEPDNALDLAETAARAGTEAFRAWWSSDDGKSCRVTAQANIDRLKQLAAEADAAKDEAPM
jgi:16S rRNA U1498 N3-methylase RsmE